jgi:hypothetical protein
MTSISTKRKASDDGADNEEVEENKSALQMAYAWAMPNKNTFLISPINKLIKKYLDAAPKDAVWVDPFANESCFNSRMKYTNDINEAFKTTHHMDALAFLQSLPDASVDGVLFDPPYTIHQINQVYAGYGDEKPVKQATAYYSEIARICKPEACVISFGFTACGVPAELSRDNKLRKLEKGSKRKTKFEKCEMLIVAHGGGHNATIIVVDKRRDK